MKICLLLPLTLILLSQAQGQVRTWASKDGKTLEATGLFWDDSGITMKRAEGGKEFKMPFKLLAKDDLQYALQNLPLRKNDNVNLRARSIKVEKGRVQSDEVRWMVEVSYISYPGGIIIDDVRATAYNPTYKASGRTVEIELSSVSGDGYAAVEFYGIAQGYQGPKRIYHSEYGVFSFEGTGSKKIFSAPLDKDYKGWVAVVRSVNTGKVIKIASSMKHYEDFVIGKIPETVKLNSDDTQIKKRVIKSLGLE